MAQIKTFAWTNPNPAVAKNFDCGFEVAEAMSLDITNGGAWMWNDAMAANSSMVVESGAYSAANGFAQLSQGARHGAPISAFSNANPGVITVDDTVAFGFAAGDTIQVEGVAESGAGTSLNGRSFTIASVTATTITLDQNTTAYKVYVSGGYVSRVSDSSGAAIPVENFAIRGITLGTTPVGANEASMVLICKSKESVT